MQKKPALVAGFFAERLKALLQANRKLEERLQPRSKPRLVNPQAMKIYHRFMAMNNPQINR